MIKYLLIIMLFVAGCGNKESSNPALLSGTGDANNDQYFSQRLAQMKAEPKSEGKITICGDSITDHLRKQGVFDNYTNVRNRGIAGITTIGLMNITDFIASEKPKLVMILIGTNDLQYLSRDGLEDRLISVIDRIKLLSPDTRVIVVSILPVVEGMPMVVPRTNRTINQINGSLKFLLKDDFYDINQLFKDFDQANKNLFLDGLHPNQLGAEILRDLYLLKMGEV